MDRPKTFQYVVIGIFVAMIILGFLGFSGKLPLPSGGQDVNYGEVTLWGTIPGTVMQDVISQKLQNDRTITIKYVEKKKSTFDREFVEALASGTGPDLFLLDQDQILSSMNKVSLIPYTSVSERDFRNTFIQEGGLFLRPQGVVALPITIDPIVMYWNRDILTNASVVVPPTKWSEFYGLVSRIVQRDGAGSISQALIPFGEYDNVAHAKDILSMLIMQSGKPIITTVNNLLSVDLVPDASELNPATRAVSFYAEFANPNKDSYTWNRSLPSSRSMFEAGDLAFYFGYASEYASIKARNPHLNFDVMLVPQTDQATKKLTFGHMQGLAIVKSSKNPTGAFRAVTLLSSREITGAVAAAAGLPPVRLDLLVTRPSDPILSVFYDAALMATAWYDPSPADTEQLFHDLMSDINSGRLKVSQALAVVQSSLSRLLIPYNNQ